MLLVIAGLGCQNSQGGEPANARAAPRASSIPPESGRRRDLSADEAAGGHTLHKHVGRSDEQLQQRLRHERHISAASTWTDRETAERAVGTALAQNRDKIESWLNRTGGHPNLVLDYDGDSSHPLGRSLSRNFDQPQPCSHATIVLRWIPPHDYYVLTSYPECRS
jgi:hypothetical protein